MSGEKKPKTVQIILGANPATKKIASADPDADSRDPVAVAKYQEPAIAGSASDVVR